ncbi:hypothetical protein D9M68_641240 [compost metagenome]
MIGKHSRGRFTVRARNANGLGLCISFGKFYFRDYRNVMLNQFLNNCCFSGYPRTFYHLIGIQNLGSCMLFFFKGNSQFLQHFFITIGNRPKVGHKNIKALFFCQHCCTNTTFARTKNNQSSLFHYLNFKVTNVIMASMMPIIQKRVTIFASWYPFF